jgi:hypothetical protein
VFANLRFGKFKSTWRRLSGSFTISFEKSLDRITNKECGGHCSCPAQNVHYTLKCLASLCVEASRMHCVVHGHDSRNAEPYIWETPFRIPIHFQDCFLVFSSNPFSSRIAFLLAIQWILEVLVWLARTFTCGWMSRCMYSFRQSWTESSLRCPLAAQH